MDTPQEVAKELGIKFQAVLGWCRLGLIRCVDLNPGAGTFFRIPKSETLRLKEKYRGNHSN